MCSLNGNSDGSDKGDYHRKWEAAINNKKKKTKYMDPLSKLRCFRLLCLAQTPHTSRVSCEIQSGIHILILDWIYAWMPICRGNIRRHSLYDTYIQKCSSHNTGRRTKQPSAARLASCKRCRELVIIPVYQSPAPPFLLSLPPLARWHTLWLICQCAGIVGAGHAWCVRDRMSR